MLVLRVLRQETGTGAHGQPKTLRTQECPHSLQSRTDRFQRMDLLRGKALPRTILSYFLVCMLKLILVQVVYKIIH